MTFEQLGLIDPILDALKSEGYENPTPIQAQSIPLLLKGQDLLACAQTGTGKTAAFALPIIQHLVLKNAQGPRKIKALIITPTRELAIQIDESFAVYGKNTKLKHTVIFGGVNQHSQVNALKAGVDILVATPGRLLDLVNQGFIKLGDISHFVLDEADRMLDMGFVHDVKKIIKIIPEKRHSLFFSATMPDTIMSLASSILTSPQKVEVTPVSSTAETIQQKIYFVDQVNKYELLKFVLKDKTIKSALVFTRTKHGADKVVKYLTRSEISAEAIHGNKSQNARQRALSNFKDRTTRVLVATDIAARGIDIDELAFVINFEIPNIPETYVHRIGRTGRAGASGQAVSFCDIEERPYLRDIQKLIKIEIKVEESHPFPAGKVAEVAVLLHNMHRSNHQRPAKTFSSHSGPKTESHQSSSSSARSTKPKKKWFRPANN
ncbi:MAG: DEAD/DEAH box helicase [Saprospiraceae bacterium]|nr:DEAD/DEAH box helicase [Saprospiraceae bacterium]